MEDILVDLVRPRKSLVISMVTNLAPEYVEILSEFQTKGGWIRLPEKIEEIRRQSLMSDYVLLYEDEKRIQMSLMLFLLGKSGLREWSATLGSGNTRVFALPIAASQSAGN